MMAVPVNASFNLSFGEARTLFGVRTPGPYAVTKNQRFLLAESIEEPGNPVQVIVNWTTELLP